MELKLYDFEELPGGAITLGLGADGGRIDAVCHLDDSQVLQFAENAVRAVCGDVHRGSAEKICGMLAGIYKYRKKTGQ